MESRLKQHNSGASLVLRESDLVILDWYPPSFGVSVIRAIVETGGQLECAAYLLRPGQPRRFDHWTTKLSAQENDQILCALLDLSAASVELETYEKTDIDFSPYEPPDRKGLRYWHEGQRSGRSMPNDQYFGDMKVPADLQGRFTAAFELAWTLVLERLPSEIRILGVQD